MPVRRVLNVLNREFRMESEVTVDASRPLLDRFVGVGHFVCECLSFFGEGSPASALTSWSVWFLTALI